MEYSCSIKTILPKNKCLFFVKHNNENENCAFSSHFLEELEPYSDYGNTQI